METKTGACHCGKIKYKVDVDLSQPVIGCNCSHCQVKGLLLSFVPGNVFTILSGEDMLTEYKFNTKKIQHLFCKECGVQPFGKGKDEKGLETIAINVRTLDAIDLQTLTRMPYEGKNI